jgi:hypothetical protein
MGLALVGVPLAGSAQVTAPTPPPAVPDVKPTPAPPEHFIMVDGSAGGVTNNELATGQGTSGFGIKAAAEIPIIGHNWVAQVDYRSYNYQHKAATGMANGITFACPVAGDPGCVTPIGFQTYDRVFNPGPINYIGAFSAQDSTTQITLGSKIAPIERYYVSVGYLLRNTNAPGYPSLGGMGFGLDKLPDVDRPFSIYGNFWLFFNVSGNYTGSNSAALGGFAGYPFKVAYRVYTYRVGATFKIPYTPVFLDLSDVGDRADVTSAAPSAAQHNAIFAGAGVKF